MAQNVRRTRRVSASLRAEIARILLEEGSDPSLSQVTITDVEASKDLKSCRVFFSARDGQGKEVTAGLKRAVPFVRRRVGESLQLRYVPELVFVEDKHWDEVNHLHQLLDSIRTERDSNSPA